MTPKLSVVIPCYNMGQFVPDAIESVLSYPNQDKIELIIVNDGSNDDGFTKQVLDGYQAKNLHIIHQENKRLGNARNTGIKAAKAPYVLPLDSDNKIRHAYIDKGIQTLDQNPEVGIYYGDNEQFGDIEQVVVLGHFDASRILVKNYIDACVVLRKSAWESVHGYDENMPVMGYEDWDLNLRLFAKGWSFKYINEVMFDYRVRENSMLVNSNKNKDLLLEYMFAKESLKPLKPIREKLIANEACQTELNNFKKRKLIKLAMKLEKPLKSINNLFR